MDTEPTTVRALHVNEMVVNGRLVCVQSVYREKGWFYANVGVQRPDDTAVTNYARIAINPGKTEIAVTEDLLWELRPWAIREFVFENLEAIWALAESLVCSE